MPTIEIAGKKVTVNEEGFMTVYDEWSDEIAKVLAAQVEIELSPRHWEVIHFLREDFKKEGESSTSRHTQTVGGFPIK